MTHQNTNSTIKISWFGEDRADAAWLAKVAERGMCRPSLMQPPEIRRLRDLTRYRRALAQDRTREQQRVEKLLEDAQIKISAVLSNLTA
jgi:transposase